ncbi:MAG: pyridoxamine 5'-phosphate oxidase family protein [Pseudomonadales bacterium]|nr:pyridoxamine 5'-phosphate oxidase family protein [Pseudomonadales bacterium]MDG1443750.1 pyridoxamine 5'-phosphate oxidase family protein [Pseudomonadales bacterium]
MQVILSSAFNGKQKSLLMRGLLLGVLAMPIAASAQSKQEPISLNQNDFVEIETQLTEDQRVISLARQVITAARYGTLVTVDDEGQPRTRIVDPFLPDDAFVIYVATKPVTRKVQQIRSNNKVSLFYFDAEGRNSVSVMGRAQLIDDLDLKLQMRRAADSDKIYPDFPQDYLLIKITPTRIEGLLPGYRGDRETWVQVGVDFEMLR